MTTRDEAIARLTAPGGLLELTTTEVDGRELVTFRNAPASLRDVVAAMAAHGDATVLVYEDERYSATEFVQLTAHLATHFAGRYGLTKGDRVVIAARNYPEWAIAFFATMSLGAIAVPLNAWWTAGELAYAIEDSGASILFCDAERWDRIADEVRRLGVRGVIVSRADSEIAGAERWEDLRAEWGDPPPLPDVSVQPLDIATIMYTSGTTGRPKGAVAYHLSHCTNIMNMVAMGAINAEIAGPQPPTADMPAPASLQVFPFFHIGGLTGLYMAAFAGSKLVTMYKWDLEEAARILVAERITATSLVPTLLRQLLESPLLDELDTTALGALTSGGASVPPDLIQKIETRFGARVAPGNGYGLTETTSAVVINAGLEYFAHPDSIGRPVIVASIRFVRDDGSEAVVGEVGELCVRGANVVKGYWNKPEATAEAFIDGWFHTGDLGYRDADGLLYVVDRIKDVVIRGGENVYSSEVEAVLFEHPAVADVAIIGLPDPRYGEEVAAIIQLHEGVTVTASELQQFVASRLAQFKVPSRVVFRDEPLPRTATGKVLKRELRDEITT